MKFIDFVDKNLFYILSAIIMMWFIFIFRNSNLFFQSLPEIIGGITTGVVFLLFYKQIKHNETIVSRQPELYIEYNSILSCAKSEMLRNLYVGNSERYVNSWDWCLQTMDRVDKWREEALRHHSKMTNWKCEPKYCQMCLNIMGYYMCMRQYIFYMQYPDIENPFKQEFEWSCKWMEDAEYYSL